MATKLNADFRSRVASAMEAGIIIGDGHSLFAPEFYAPHFTAEELTEAGLVQTYESDGSLKGSIYDRQTGEPLDSLEGVVYNLTFLYWVARGIGDTRYPMADGRGSQASELVGFIRETLAQ